MEANFLETISGLTPDERRLDENVQPDAIPESHNKDVVSKKAFLQRFYEDMCPAPPPRLKE